MNMKLALSETSENTLTATADTILPIDYRPSQEKKQTDRLFFTDLASNLPLDMLDIENKRKLPIPVYSHSQLTSFTLEAKQESKKKSWELFKWAVYDPRTGKQIFVSTEVADLQSEYTKLDDGTFIVINSSIPDYFPNGKSENVWHPYIFKFSKSTNTWTQILLKEGVTAMKPSEYAELYLQPQSRVKKAISQLDHTVLYS